MQLIDKWSEQWKIMDTINNLIKNGNEVMAMILNCDPAAKNQAVRLELGIPCIALCIYIGK
jgi:hypothetical protein